MLRSKNLLKVHTNNTRVKRQKKLQAVEEKGAYGFQRFFHRFIFLTTGAPTKAIHFGESGGELSNLHRRSSLLRRQGVQNGFKTVLIHFHEKIGATRDLKYVKGN